MSPSSSSSNPTFRRLMPPRFFLGGPSLPRTPPPDDWKMKTSIRFPPEWRVRIEGVYSTLNETCFGPPPDEPDPSFLHVRLP